MSYAYETAHTSPNQNARPAGVVPSLITIHHWGADGQRFDSVRDYLCRTGGNTSAHYVAEAGRVACIVAPARRAWHAGNTLGNDVSIGIECRPEASDGDYATVAELVRALRATYGDLPLVPHSYWKATACPGRWDLARIDRLARETAPTTPDDQEVDVMALYIRGDKANTVYAFDTASGTRRIVEPKEWRVVAAAGVKLTVVPQDHLDALEKIVGGR